MHEIMTVYVGEVKRIADVDAIYKPGVEIVGKRATEGVDAIYKPGVEIGG